MTETGDVRFGSKAGIVHVQNPSGVDGLSLCGYVRSKRGLLQCPTASVRSGNEAAATEHEYLSSGAYAGGVRRWVLI